MVDRDHSHQRSQNHHIAFAGCRTELETELAGHRNHLVDLEIDLEIAGCSWVRLTEELVEAFRRTEGNRRQVFQDIQSWDHLGDCSLVESHQGIVQVD